MAIPGNQFWKLRSKHGRDRIFKTPEILKEAAYEYFQWCQDNPFKEAQIVKYKEHYETAQVPKMRPFTIQGLCRHLGCNKDYFTDFKDSLRGKDDEVSIDFSRIITHIYEVIYDQKFSGSASGFFNANIIARDLKLTDRIDNTIKLDQESLPPWFNE